MTTSPATTDPPPPPSPPPPPPSSTVEVPVAAKAIGVSDWAAYQAIKNGTFPVPIIRVGRRIVVPRAPLERLLAGEAR